MTLSDAALGRLLDAIEEPDLEGDRYELVERRARGGMGTIYVVRDRELDRDVALKVLTAVGGETEAGARMLREARVLARLEHPGIVPVHDVGVLSDGRAYYTMKLVDGPRLDEHVGSLRTVAEVTRVMQRLCETVAFAHDSGFLHRDLKPANIMIGRFGEVLVMDWGLAKPMIGGAEDEPRSTRAPARGEGMTSAGTVLGTPGFMAPEQAGARSVDARADVFGLGAVLFFMLAGHAPAAGVSYRAELKTARFPVPPPLAAICSKALATDPAARYASVAEMNADLGAFLAGERVAAMPESWAGSLARIAKKNRAPVGLILAYLLVRIALILFNRR